MGRETCTKCIRDRRARYIQAGSMVCEPCVIRYPALAAKCIECWTTYPLIDGAEYPGCVCYDLDMSADEEMGVRSPGDTSMEPPDTDDFEQTGLDTATVLV
jgi:hypothetical protein